MENDGHSEISDGWDQEARADTEFSGQMAAVEWRLLLKYIDVLNN